MKTRLNLDEIRAVKFDNDAQAAKFYLIVTVLSIIVWHVCQT